MNLLEQYIATLKKNGIEQNEKRLLIAVSGGVDSVVLCHLCHAAGIPFSIAHCNFQLRNEESNRDEAFVKALAEKYKVPFFIERFDTKQYAENQKLSIQVAARELRYDWFFKLLEKHPELHYLATAHHRDDNVETVLMNFFKGTGINGLKGISFKQGRLIRPLLFASREEILLYAQENKLHWVEDSSNAEVKYARNYIRHEIIPAIEKRYPTLKENIAATIERMDEAEDLYREAVTLHLKKLLEYKGNEIHIPVLKLRKAKPLHTLLYEIIKDYNFTPHQVAEVEKLLTSESGKYIASSTHRVLRNRAWLIISPLQTMQAQTIIIEKEDDSISYPAGVLQIKAIENPGLPGNENIREALVDASVISYPLVLRPFKAGDYFYPLGMRKKKKLARFFIDLKLSKTEKEKVWVLESDKRIVWVLGLRIDDRFKLSPTTKKGLQLNLTSL